MRNITVSNPWKENDQEIQDGTIIMSVVRLVVASMIVGKKILWVEMKFYRKKL
jgi:hypothetical protein